MQVLTPASGLDAVKDVAAQQGAAVQLLELAGEAGQDESNGTSVGEDVRGGSWGADGDGALIM